MSMVCSPHERNCCRGQLVIWVKISFDSRKWPENPTQCRMAPGTLTCAQINRSLKPMTGRSTQKQNNTDQETK